MTKNPNARCAVCGAPCRIHHRHRNNPSHVPSCRSCYLKGRSPHGQAEVHIPAGVIDRSDARAAAIVAARHVPKESLLEVLDILGIRELAAVS